MDNIRIVRFKNGEDVICEQLKSDDDAILIGSPMRINLLRDPRTPDRPFVAMSPWLPLHIVKNNMAEIFREDILTFIEPTDALAEYYSTMVHQYEDAHKKQIDLIEAQFHNEMQEEEVELDEDGLPSIASVDDLETVEYLRSENRLN